MTLRRISVTSPDDKPWGTSGFPAMPVRNQLKQEVREAEKFQINNLELVRNSLCSYILEIYIHNKKTLEWNWDQDILCYEIFITIESFVVCVWSWGKFRIDLDKRQAIYQSLISNSNFRKLQTQQISQTNWQSKELQSFVVTR